MRVKTRELEGAALDWAVAEALDLDQWVNLQGTVMVRGRRAGGKKYTPSTDWSQGGPLIQRFAITLGAPGFMKSGNWEAFVGAYIDDVRGPQLDLVGSAEAAGGTPLIAAMRAIVAAELGDHVDIPDELLAGD